MRAVDGHPGPASHDDAVNQRDIGFWVAMDEPIEFVFLTPEHPLGDEVPGLALIVQQANITPGAEGPFPRAANDDALDVWIKGPRLKRRCHQTHHAEVEGVQRFGPVQPDFARHATARADDLSVTHQDLLDASGIGGASGSVNAGGLRCRP